MVVVFYFYFFWVWVYGLLWAAFVGGKRLGQAASLRMSKCGDEINGLSMTRLSTGNSLGVRRYLLRPMVDLDFLYGPRSYGPVMGRINGFPFVIVALFILIAWAGLPHRIKFVCPPFQLKHYNNLIKKTKNETDDYTNPDDE